MYRSAFAIGSVVAAAVITGILVGSALTDDDGRDRSERRSDRGERREKAAEPPASAPDAATLNDRGFQLMNSGRYRQAIPLLERAVESSNESSLTHAYALYNLGRSLRLAGRTAEAIPILERRLRIPNQRETVARELNAARRAAAR